MRLTLQLLGFDLDVSLAPSDTPTLAPDGASLDGGTTYSTPLGFVAAYDMPDEAAIHRPCSPWEDDSEC